MAEVPAWLLVIQTLAAGGLGLAGSFIVPASQRAAHKAARLQAHHELMRSKAEAIFAEINRIREAGNEASRQAFEMVAGRRDDPGYYDVAMFRQFDMVAGLVAIYFPDGLPIISAGLAKMRAQTDPINAAIVGGTGPIFSEEGLRLRAQMVSAVAGANADVAAAVERYMIEAVRPYHPEKLTA